ncbi:hypothetical protein Pst134EA_015032 [Puccinia striiformis f. sp. tritici]|uniref:Uncharacterized protein n=1 Tax=Puccinia striiformis f. sp. tritici PST-78 TaxID=1165861 RepID=A0A0L0VEQ1_9BASI|nr:hypothetical protein Pst134EA_015032 [Puccinia striiformis f. sp. tritici]KAI9610238.1 hypothetical protein KEM48_002599 [Puccinia striiformis f. sp. tritici PST-130]KNE97674.1 hypothetical protein PSTG_09078 [Puccinia striiformis f. sp. tritici PST-78]KAH9452199.1 hypothetical protein Pst134EB_016155 [Puccinia striiformis f. sp. tritici]KAH9462948.1 hypothetical protein Pst134EA_015032 [Puccinia striiformis f. sp. tritici]KNE97676.1 hypothetical protein PSTG_09080 [Puccinia striiformis f. 
MLHTRLEIETAALDWKTVLVTTVTTALSKNLLNLSEKQSDTTTNYVVGHLNKSYSANMIIPLFAIFAIFIFLFYKVVAGRRAQAKTLSKDYLEAWHEEWRAGQELKRKEHVAQVERQHAEHSAQDTVRNKQLLALIE